MSILPIIQIDDNPTNPLRAVSRPVSLKEFGTPELIKTIADMQETLSQIDDGVALAAPQVSIAKRIFVVAPQAYDAETKWRPLVFINPEITRASRKTAEMSEGCLSVRWIYGKTIRALQVTVEAYNEHGVKFTYGASGLPAHIIQHECDHLDATLFVDHGYDLEEYTEEDIKNGFKKHD